MAADTLTHVYDRPVTGVRKLLRMRVGERRPFSELLLGFAGDAALVPLVAAGMEFKHAPGSDDDVQAWVDGIAQSVTQAAVEAGIVDDGRMDGLVVLGWHGRVWTIGHSYSIPHEDGVAAVGSGEGLALGAIDTLLAGGVPPQEAVVAGLQVAMRRDRHTGGSIQVEMLP